MTIDEAIVVLDNEARVAEVNDHPREVKAFKLGIEALKRYKIIRANFSKLKGDRLEGETEE